MTDYAALSNEELSAEIARRLFGWKWYRRQSPITWSYFLSETQPEDDAMLTGKARAYDPYDSTDEYYGHLTLEPYEGAPYASDHNAAMGLVVPEMRKRPGSVIFECEVTEAGSWASFRRNHAPGVSGCAESGELPRAICEACLCALDATEPSQ